MFLSDRVLLFSRSVCKDHQSLEKDGRSCTSSGPRGPPVMLFPVVADWDAGLGRPLGFESITPSSDDID